MSPSSTCRLRLTLPFRDARVGAQRSTEAQNGRDGSDLGKTAQDPGPRLFPAIHSQVLSGSCLPGPVMCVPAERRVREEWRHF